MSFHPDTACPKSPSSEPLSKPSSQPLSKSAQFDEGSQTPTKFSSLRSVASLRSKPFFLLFALSFSIAPNPLLACSVCYGQSDSPMAYGFNAAIITLLVVVLAVLGSIAGFFVYLAKRASSPPQPDLPTPTINS